MLPEISIFGLFSIPTYGLMMAIGFLLGMNVVGRVAERGGQSVEKVIDLALILFVGGLVGCRLLFVITNFNYFWDNPLDVFKVWQGGFVFYGGLLVDIPAAFWFCRRFKLNVWASGDALLSGLTLGHAIGRIGCVGAGCCHGKATDSLFGMKFDSPFVQADLRGVPIHPTQIYESFALFVIYAGLMWIVRNKKFDGQVVIVYLLTYPIVRSVIEVFRGDKIREFVIDDVLSTSQFISVIVFLVALGMLFWRSREMSAEVKGGTA